MSQMLLAQIVEELAKGERAPEEILASLRPQEERMALMRCAVVRSFDRELAESLLLTDNASSFDDVVALPDIEPVPREDATFWVRPSARSAHWRAWWSADASIAPTELPLDLRALLERLVEHYAERDQPLDLLAHCALVEPDRAAELFDTLYRKADGAFDLPACQDLIDVLSDPDRIGLLTSRLTELRRDRQAYLRARGVWSADYFHTARFLEPAGVADAYEELIDPVGPRTLNLHAPGGRGKTIQLRWLIARRLVPDAARGGMAGGRVPCAKVDLDFIDPVNATRYPWIVLLEIAAQLNDQLPNPPFSSLLEEHGWATPLLRRNPADLEPVNAASRRVQSQGERVGERVIGKFAQILSEHVGDAPVVFVFDTLEEIHLRPQGDLEALLALLGKLLDSVSGLRLVLAGRYPIREILDSVAELLPALAELAVLPFADSESDRYITELRGIKQPATRAVIVEKAGGDPFLLSMLADVVQGRPRLSPAEIRRYPADVIHLIRRVVQRIQEPGVRWLLRYGVVPRRLTLAFVRDVMQPYLRDAMSGRLSHDDPADDELPNELDDIGQSSFRTDLLKSLDAQLSLADLWAELRRYAGSTSWVSEVPGSADTLRFRAEVVASMRAVIRSRQVYRLLHEDAIRHFEAKANAEPQQWETWMREAIYHRFQLEGAAAVPYWRAALDAAGEASPGRREAIAAELLEPDYVDEHGVPLPWIDDRPIVDPATLVEARFERCLALVELARQRDVPPDDPLWSQAEKGLADIQEAERVVGHSVIGGPGLAYVRGALALKAGHHDDAEAAIRAALPQAHNAADMARLELLLGDVEFARGDRAAAASYRRALLAASAPERGASIRRKIMLAEAEVDSLDEAHAEYERALAATSSSRERAELKVLGATIELRCGDATLAEETAHRAGAEAGTTMCPLRVAAAIALHDVRRALRLATEVDELTGSGTPSGEVARAREAVGVAASALMDYVEAGSALETARSLWHSHGDLEAVARCSAVSAALEMRQVGDLKVAEQHLNETETVEVVAYGDSWLESRLLRAELLASRGDDVGAATSAAETLDGLGAGGAPPRRMIRAAVAALAYGDPGRCTQVLDTLLEQCRLVTPVSARVVALAGLKDVAELPDRGCAEGLSRLRDAVRIPPDARLGELDRAILGMTIAELERLGGDVEAASSHLMRAHEALTRSPTSYWLRPWNQALDRLGQGPRVTARPDIERFLDELAVHPMLCGAFLVERAEEMIASGAQGARELLDNAARRLGDLPGRETQWHVRLRSGRAMLAEREQSIEARELFATASAGAVVLGRPGPTPTPPGRHDPMWELARRRATVRLSRNSMGIEIDAIIAAGATAVHKHEVVFDPFAGLEPRDLEALAWRWMSERRDSVASLGKVLFGLLGAPRPADARLEVRLEIADRALRAIPWELARTESHDALVSERGVSGVVRTHDAETAARDETTFVQTALNHALDARLPVDAEFGPRTCEALAEFQHRAGLQADGTVREDDLTRLQRDMVTAQRPLAVLVQPSTARQVYAVRGKASTGVDIERFYEYSGFRILRLETPAVGDVRAALDRVIANSDVPAILHFSGGLRELGGGIALTFLAGEWSQEALGGWRPSDELSVTALDFVLDCFPRDVFRPLVILDIDSPHTPTESAAQLFLRNAFAADVFALGHCPALLATGLTTGTAYALYETMVAALGRGASVLETCASVQRLPTYDPEDVGPCATALFTHLPWLRPSPP